MAQGSACAGRPWRASRSLREPNVRIGAGRWHVFGIRLNSKDGDRERDTCAGVDRSSVDKAPSVGRWHRSKRASARAQAAGGSALSVMVREKTLPARPHQLLRPTAKLPRLGVIASLPCSISPPSDRKEKGGGARAVASTRAGLSTPTLTLSARVLSLV